MEYPGNTAATSGRGAVAVVVPTVAPETVTRTVTGSSLTPDSAQPRTSTVFRAGAVAPSNEPNGAPTTTVVDHGYAALPFCTLDNVTVYGPGGTGTPESSVMFHVTSTAEPEPDTVRTVAPAEFCTASVQLPGLIMPAVIRTRPLPETVRWVTVADGRTRPEFPISCAASRRMVGRTEYPPLPGQSVRSTSRWPETTLRATGVPAAYRDPLKDAATRVAVPRGLS